MSDLGDPVDLTRQRELMVAVEFALRSEGTSLSTLFRAAGLPSDDPSLQTVAEALPGRTVGALAEDVADLEDLHPAAKLSLLRDAAASLRQSESEDQVRQELEPLARALVTSGVQGGTRDTVIGRLFDDLRANPTGEPLGRTPADLAREPGPESDDATQGSTAEYLVADARDTLLSDGCSMDPRALDGQSGVLEIVGDMYATGDLAGYEPIIDPAQWPNCVISGLFFRHMKRLPVAGGELAGPDSGYHARFEETVDFSLGFAVDGLVMSTELDICHWNNVSRPEECHRSLGATYALPAQPLTVIADPPITFDRGYLLAEETYPGIASPNYQSLIHLRTLKQVRFNDFDVFLPLVCAVWRLSSGALWACCLQHP